MSYSIFAPVTHRVLRRPGCWLDCLAWQFKIGPFSQESTASRSHRVAHWLRAPCRKKPQRILSHQPSRIFYQHHLESIIPCLFLPCSATNRSTCGCSTTNRRTRGCITSGCSTTNCSVPGFSVTNRSIPGFSATNRSTVVVVLQTDVLQIVLFRDLDTMQSPMSLVGPSS